ncbi:uncharacterized protein At5g19025-like [Phalaenopsis equestris]|uniref:uncharacterized protein At5g19025-like n=1 Tax=Phalaenopsis equestris TaxID=78828 RepID=UPI0009E319F7|nr:uncharacterized protein At5g19025-like [Phalaenopsis equestris]
MVDCRSLIEFCRSFEQHRQMPMESRSNLSHGRCAKVNLFSPSFCEHSSFAPTDVLMLLLVLGSVGVLTLPYFELIYNEASELVPVAVDLMSEVVCPSFVAYFTGFALILITGVVLWGVFSHQLRKCGNPRCRGLRKAVEFNIQLESEECVRFMPAFPKGAFGSRQLELGQDHRELEAELKKMAPLNGRTVLIFRSPCGCPTGRMEVWGQKKVRRIKK